MTILSATLWAAAGGAVGTIARYGLSEAVARTAGKPYLPLATLAVNVTGCFILGVVVALAQREGQGWSTSPLRPLLVAGLCGGLTTFSGLGLELLTLVERRQYGVAAGLIALHVALGLAALVGGRAIAGGGADLPTPPLRHPPPGAS